MSIDTIELCSSRDVGQGGVGGARKCDLADIGATMVKCCDDARREGTAIDLVTWDEANLTARDARRVTHNAGALRGRRLLDAQFRKAMTEGKITASVTTSQDELSPVSMIVRSSAPNGSYQIEFLVDGANNKLVVKDNSHELLTLAKTTGATTMRRASAWAARIVAPSSIGLALVETPAVVRRRISFISSRRA